MRGSVLVLWDIDHTLIQTGGVGREVYQSAFEHATGITLLRYPAPAGQLEPELFAEVLSMHNVSDQGSRLWHAFAVEQARLYSVRSSELARRGRVLPGVVGTLLDFAGKGLAQTVVTGNTRPAARAKLASFGLTEHLDMASGSYGTDAPTRTDLVRSARSRFESDRAVVIGDTAADMRAGRAAGAWTIGVATGVASEQDLALAGANVAVRDLTKRAAVRQLVERVLVSNEPSAG